MMKRIYFLLETSIMLVFMGVFFWIFAVTSMREYEGITFYFIYLIDGIGIFVSISEIYQERSKKNILALILTICAWVAIVLYFSRL